MTVGADVVVVAGRPGPEELAAVLAVLRRPAPPEPSGYERWREHRRRALDAGDGRLIWNGHMWNGHRLRGSTRIG